MQTTTIPAVKLHTTGTSTRQVMMSCVNVLFSFFSFLFFFFSFSFPEQTMCIPPVPDQDLHVTLSEARIREDGHQARIVRSQQLTNQPVNIPQHKEFGTNTRGRSTTQGISPSDESENSTSHSAASTAPRAFASTYEKAATPRQPPL